MHGDGTVLATLPRALLGFAATRGVDAAALARDAGLAEMSWDDVDERVPRGCVDALWELAAERTGDPAIGVALAAAIPPGNAGVVEYVMLNSATVGESLAHCVRYWHILNDGADMRLARGGDVVRLVLRPRNGRPFARPWLEFAVAVMASGGPRVTRDPVRPLEVCLPFPRGPSSGALEALVPSPFRYDAPALEYVLPAALMSVPLVSANTALRDVLVEHAERVLARVPRERDVAAEVRAQIVARLERGDTTLEPVAAALGLSPRTLQRQLRALGTSHSELLDEARHALALRKLADPSVGVADVAFLLGFAETSTFHRAFRRWTGAAPSEYRARLRGLAPAAPHPPPATR